MVIEYLASFTGLASTFKSATDLTKAISDATDDIAIKAKSAELQTQILAAQNSALTAQSAQFTLLEQIRDLEAKVTDLEAWDTEKARYLLQEVRVGAFAYQLKPEAANGEPPHQICATCYQRGKKSILNNQTLSVMRAEILVCPSCTTVIYIRGHAMKEHKDAVAVFRSK
jgi:hypothetical protein